MGIALSANIPCEAGAFSNCLAASLDIVLKASPMRIAPKLTGFEIYHSVSPLTPVLTRKKRDIHQNILMYDP